MRLSRCLLIGLALVSLTALWPPVHALDEEGGGEGDEEGGDGDGEYDGQGYGDDDDDEGGGGGGAPAEIKQLTTLAEVRRGPRPPRARAQAARLARAPRHFARA
jgi:hypothetical protein